MATFVLVHGAWHGGWCWHKIVARLEALGHKAVAPDMPGHGRDPQPIASVTMGDIVERVHRTIDAQKEPVILVGHSYGGAIITQAAEGRSKRIKSLVYLTAFLLGDGQSLMNLAEQDSESHLGGQVEFSDDGRTATVKAEALRDCFYAGCSDDDVALARALLGPEAIAGMRAPMKTSMAGFGRVPRSYIECRRDHAISPALQKRLYTEMPCERVFSLDTDHSPFFSDPDGLTALLARLA